MLISLIIMMAVTIVAVFFALENTEVVRVSLFGYPLEGAIGVFLLMTFGIGVLLGVLLMVPAMISRSIAIARHKRKIGELEQFPPE
jgi:putative membrane protein